MPRSRRVELGWEHPESGEEFRVVCSVSPGSPGRGPDLNGPGEPPEAPEVEIIEVVEDRPGGVERPDILPLVQAAFDQLEPRAVAKADADELDAFEADCAAERDARRDEVRPW